MRTTSVVETALDHSELPPAAVDVIRRVVMNSRLWPSERMDVLEEMVSHFHDRLEAGEPVGGLLARFGDPAETAALIRGATKRRQRPAAWRAAFVTVRISALVLVVSHAAQRGARRVMEPLWYLQARGAAVAALGLRADPAVQVGSRFHPNYLKCNAL